MTKTEYLDTYVSAWQEPDRARRAAALESAFAVDGVYCDPTAYVAGRDALVDHIGNVYESLGGFEIGPTSGYDEHHGFVRWTWRMTWGSGEHGIDGLNFARLADDGRVVLIAGFFEAAGGTGA